MDFRLVKDTELGGWMMVAENQDKEVKIHKTSKNFVVVEFQYNPLLREITDEPFYEVIGETVEMRPIEGETFKSMAERYNEEGAK